MTQIYDRGTICSVPRLGPNAWCLLLSDARGVSRGRPEYQVAPLYQSLPYEPGKSDAVIDATETTLNRRLFAGLWNVRPLLAADLGEPVGFVTRDAVLSDLRDAFLQLVDPSIGVAASRVGTAQIDARASAWRAAEIGAWQPLTGRLLGGKLASEPAHVEEFRAAFHLYCASIGAAEEMFSARRLVYSVLSDWGSVDTSASEALLGVEDVLLYGRNRVVLRLSEVCSTRREPARVAGPKAPHHVPRAVVTSVQSYGGRISDLTLTRENVLECDAVELI